MNKMGEWEFTNEGVANLRNKTILQALQKILSIEASKVVITVPGYEISAYDMKHGTIRIDVKLIH